MLAPDRPKSATGRELRRGEAADDGGSDGTRTRDLRLDRPVASPAEPQFVGPRQGAVTAGVTAGVGSSRARSGSCACPCLRAAASRCTNRGSTTDDRGGDGAHRRSDASAWSAGLRSAARGEGWLLSIGSLVRVQLGEPFFRGRRFGARRAARHAAPKHRPQRPELRACRNAPVDCRAASDTLLNSRTLRRSSRTLCGLPRGGAS